MLCSALLCCQDEGQFPPMDVNIHAIVNSYPNGTYSAHSIMFYSILLYLVEPISLTLFTLLFSALFFSLQFQRTNGPKATIDPNAQTQ